MHNILDNHFKAAHLEYFSKGGNIPIVNAYVENIPNGMLKIVTIDNGIGMNEDEMNRLFNPGELSTYNQVGSQRTMQIIPIICDFLNARLEIYSEKIKVQDLN